METRIGISGWVYPPWRGVFYPSDLTQKKELFYASRVLSSIEINGTFYSSQNPNSFLHWYEETPEGFGFSVKGPRYITHIRRLREVEIPLANFFASGVLHLEDKLKAFLWQLPPNFPFDEERLETFFKLLPRTFKDAAKYAKQSDRHQIEYPESITKSTEPLRHALEVRHHSFENPDFIKLLRKYGITLVFADTAGKWPYMEDVTGDFLYLRLHGPEELYTSGYDEPTLRWWADRIRVWTSGKQPADALTISDHKPSLKKRSAYIYFDNDIKVRAPFDAQTLARIINQKPKETFSSPQELSP